jgi:glutamate/tyrosine decarboxylase-like PLP-dependent enzyme
MSLEWARARALANAARLAASAAAQGHGEVAGQPIGPVLCWRPRAGADPEETRSVKLSVLGEAAPVGHPPTRLPLRRSR